VAPQGLRHHAGADLTTDHAVINAHNYDGHLPPTDRQQQRMLDNDINSGGIHTMPTNWGHDSIMPEIGVSESALGFFARAGTSTSNAAVAGRYN
jgi:hypothetical protein